MTQQRQTEKPKIFISHAWKNKALVRRLEKDLKAAGAEVWVDHSGIRGGDNLPERINDALAWCNTLLLIWSNAASKSRWVKLEWTNAISLDKAIIPCLLDKAELPPMLANRAYIEFSSIDQGLVQLLRALNLAQQSLVKTPDEFSKQVASIAQNKLSDVPSSVNLNSHPASSSIFLSSAPVQPKTLPSANASTITKPRLFSPWNLFDYLRLLWWVVAKPKALKAYKAGLNADALNRLKRQCSWLASLLIWWPWLIFIVWVFLDTRIQFIVETKLWLPITLGLTWLLAGILGHLEPDSSDDSLDPMFFLPTCTVVVIASVIIIPKVAAFISITAWVVLAVTFFITNVMVGRLVSKITNNIHDPHAMGSFAMALGAITGIAGSTVGLLFIYYPDLGGRGILDIRPVSAPAIGIGVFIGIFASIAAFFITLFITALIEDYDKSLS